MAEDKKEAQNVVQPDVLTRERQDISSPLVYDNESKIQINALQKETKATVEDLKKDFLIIFGIFASFVTFLSIEVQLFKTNDNILELIGVSSISVSFIMAFATTINEITKIRSVWKEKIPIYLITSLFLGAGILCLFLGAEQKNEISAKEIKDKEIIDSLQNEVKSLHAKYWQVDLSIKEIQIEINNPPSKKDSL